MTTRLDEAPAPPRNLSRAARTEWLRLAPLAITAASVTIEDLPALALLCEAMATEKSLRAVLNRDGPTLRTATGGRKAHPALKAAAEARAQAMRLLAEFGMTPRGRNAARAAAPPEKRPSAFSLLRQGKRAGGTSH